MTGVNIKMWCFMLTHIGFFILQHLFSPVITNGPTHCLKGELAKPNVTIHFQNLRLFWRTLIKPDLAIGKNIGWQE